MLLSDYNSQVRELVHDLSTVDWQDSEITGYINNARKRVALDSHCVRQFITGLNLVPNTELYQFTGSIGGYVITAGGSGYVNPQVAVGAAPAGGVNATAAATQTGGVVTSVLPTNWGSLYTTAPTVSITDSGGPGAGATATPIFLQSVIDVVSATVIWPGGLQAWVLNWSPWTEFQAWSRAYRGTFRCPVEMSTIQETQLMAFGRIPDQAYSLELDVVRLPNLLVNQSDSDVQVIDPWADAVQWWAAYLAMMKLQSYQHADYFDKAYNKRLKQIIATKQVRRIRNIYGATFRRRLRGG